MIVDLAAESGGNCELTEPGEIVEKHGVTIVGIAEPAATVPRPREPDVLEERLNMVKLLRRRRTARSTTDFKDEILAGCVITHDGTHRATKRRREAPRRASPLAA